MRDLDSPTRTNLVGSLTTARSLGHFGAIERFLIESTDWACVVSSKRMEAMESRSRLLSQFESDSCPRDGRSPREDGSSLVALASPVFRGFALTPG